jgi:hypothetical protein
MDRQYVDEERGVRRRNWSGEVDDEDSISVDLPDAVAADIPGKPGDDQKRPSDFRALKDVRKDGNGNVTAGGSRSPEMQDLATRSLADSGHLPSAAGQLLMLLTSPDIQKTSVSSGRLR